ncbi:MlaD family protein [Pedococcus sp.]|uniref:MlaD family protein n=1 Tax=Pedococcus sp. TaxID=2860345 RepID=UPI002E14145D|nr:MlaD family protein [Pedococcus sp.]
MSTRASLVKFLVFVAVTLLATGTLAATIANVQFGDKAHYQAIFTDVTGLAPGQEVRIAGVRVGEVTSIQVAPDRIHAKVGMDVLKTSVLTQGTKATIKYRNLVGERYIALTQDVGGATPLRDGATIGLDHTQSALDLTVLFNGFKPLFAALSPKDVNELSGEIISVLQGEGGNVNSLLATTASLTSTLADRDAVIGRTITNLNTVLGTVDAHDSALKQLIDQLQRFVSGLAADRQTIGASLTNINSLTAQTADLLQLTRPSIKSDIENLRALTTNLNKPSNTAIFEKFLATSPAKIDQITKTGSYGSWFNFYMCDFSGTIKVPVGPAIQLGKPGGATAARCK